MSGSRSRSVSRSRSRSVSGSRSRSVSRSRSRSVSVMSSDYEVEESPIKSSKKKPVPKKKTPITKKGKANSDSSSEDEMSLASIKRKSSKSTQSDSDFEPGDAELKKKGAKKIGLKQPKAKKPHLFSESDHASDGGLLAVKKQGSKDSYSKKANRTPIKKKAQGKPSSVKKVKSPVAHTFSFSEESSDEEPLANIKKKTSESHNGPAPKSRKGSKVVSDSSSDEEMPLASTKGKKALKNSKAKESSAEEDPLPNKKVSEALFSFVTKV